MKWHDLFKIAIVEEDVNAIDSLLKEIPEFKRIDDMREAYALIGAAKEKFEQEQSIIKDKMNKIKRAKKFVEVERRQSKLDKVS